MFLVGSMLFGTGEDGSVRARKHAAATHAAISTPHFVAHCAGRGGACTPLVVEQLTKAVRDREVQAHFLLARISKGEQHARMPTPVCLP